MALLPLLLLLLTTHATADGTGLIGHGKTLYHPPCAFACRGVLKGCILACTSTDSTKNHGTAHNPVATSPKCFVRDHAFLKTMALCIDTYCPVSDNPDRALVEDYWASHLGTGTLGDYAWVPVMGYQEALEKAKEDEREVGAGNTHNSYNSHADHHTNHRRQFMTPAGPNISSPLPVILAKQPLNRTSFVPSAAWQAQYSGMSDFETNEAGHATTTIILTVLTIFLPLLLSLLRFLPRTITHSQTYTTLQSTLINTPLWGRKHRQESLGSAPTRGQALYITFISILNITFLLTPYVYHHPQATFPSLAAQQLSVIGNRAGVLAMGNAVALWLFAARNSVLLWLTDWSYTTYLLMHRWLGYWTVVHAVVHSGMLWGYYLMYGDYEKEVQREYWVWGIVATVAVVVIGLVSVVGWVRRRVYEVFLASHMVLAVVFVVGYYWHIWWCYGYAWGYEIWAFVVVGIWGSDRVLRVGRMVGRGYRTAVVSVVEATDGEYLLVDVEGVELGEGVVYLTFPGLGWKCWESHPFSVAFHSGQVKTESPSEPEKETSKTPTVTVASAAHAPPSNNNPSTTFLVRIRTGITASLAQRASTTGSARLGVLIDGPYPHSGDVETQLKHCSNIVCIAGGVGVTAVLPYLRRFLVPSRLYFSTRKAGLAAAIEPALAALSPSVEAEVTIGQRLDSEGILDKALQTVGHGGPVGVVVCGPPGMADDVRHRVVQLTRNGTAIPGCVLVDEAFGW